jgi:2-keto-3-deoxy-L-fuconate dehydrogenase
MHGANQIEPSGVAQARRINSLASRLKSKVALVSAAGQGIGRAIAEAFIAEGAHVIATDIDEAKLESLAAQGLALDVRSTADVGRVAAIVARDLGALDVLVNCAGYVHQGTVLQCSEEDWDFSFDLNVKSIHRMIAAFLPGMLDKGGGSIINIASVVSSIRGVPNRYVYGATKAAIIGLTKAVAADFITKGLRVNAICPGTIASPSLEQRIAALAQSSGQSREAVLQSFIDRQPMGRLGTPDEVAALAVFLASDEASYITGQIHLVDGGMAL